MAELVVYPDAHPEVSSVDGWVGRSIGAQLWAAIRDGAGNEALPSALVDYLIINGDYGLANWWRLRRFIMLFDTSPIPPTAHIVSAEVYVNIRGGSTPGQWSLAYTVVTSNPASNIDLVAADYGTLGETPLSNIIPYADIVFSGNIFTLNALGRAAIAGGGITKLGLREYNYDCLNVEPYRYSTRRSGYIEHYSADKGGLFRPKLTITYITLPTTTTDPATGDSTLNGTLDDDGDEACDCGFEWGLTAAYGNTTPTQNRTTGQTFSQTIGGLAPGTTYHFRAFATNLAGTSYGADRTFATSGALPIVTTQAATAVTQTNGTINGLLDNDGGEACECGFEWGLTTTYGDTTPTQSKTTGQTFSQNLGGLVPGTVYHFRAFATNSFGTGYGADMSFTATPIVSKAYPLGREEL